MYFQLIKSVIRAIYWAFGRKILRLIVLQTDFCNNDGAKSNLNLSKMDKNDRNALLVIPIENQNLWIKIAKE